MLLIGTLEQFRLASVLQRVETYEKTGLLVLQQGAYWVEFYLRDGQVLCIGPLRTNATLGERLLQDGVISPRVLQETLLVLGAAEQNETRVARTLMELGYVSRDELRAWAIQKATDVLQALVLWQQGNIYFDEGTPPPAGRLLVAMSITSLLETAVPVQPAQVTYMPFEPDIVQEQQPALPITPQADVTYIPAAPEQAQYADVPTPHTSSLLPDASSQSLSTPSLPSFADAMPPLLADVDDSVFSSFADLNDTSEPSPTPSIQPMPVMHPVTPKRINTEFMQPNMVLFPVDLSAFREQNPQVQLTPDQWRLLTRVDGQTSLQTACQELSMLPELVCQVAGELIAESLIYVSLPTQVPTKELSPVSRELTTSGMNNGYITPGASAMAASPWSAVLPPEPTDEVPSFASAIPFETQSQWGNGGNGATFVPGRGWVASPPPQPAYSSSTSTANHDEMYAQASGSGVYYR